VSHGPGVPHAMGCTPPHGFVVAANSRCKAFLCICGVCVWVCVCVCVCVCVTSAQLHDVQDFNNTALTLRFRQVADRQSVSAYCTVLAKGDWGLCAKQLTSESKNFIRLVGAHGVGACAIRACSGAGRVTRTRSVARIGLHTTTRFCRGCQLTV
jgi:hypothetical protein